ncbi:TonB-dependent receptor [Herminiimonas fonticola]|uniref:Iron complex outermembrane receptor protein n=1 Tax=Herminiimonas fonticola TaxID=303380 RepID=A0A4R6GFT1_9BURK|nr:TonB-dependent receptor [Herminiimonas fonticola]RBA24510.1 TonB dependent receptor [Herminiimonas fonticola]TDN93627.1 iron complex outermembrane receptor protein [Herminiimonas fonticola]
MRFRFNPIYTALLVALSTGSYAEDAQDSVVKTLGTITVTSGRPTSLPTQIPTTFESITKEQIQQTINATDSEDALKYFPSLLVRKRYIGDYDHAVLASRASGTGNSARSLVYADGILLSNLLGNGASFTPRWGMVTPEEIERVDVLYGPFSAAYPGNSAGAVVDYVTRMPDKFEGHAKVSGFTQNYDLYGTHSTFSGHQESVSLGDRRGAWSWWINASHLDSDGQPIVIVSKPLSTTASAANPVTGAVAGKDTKNNPTQILGTTGQTQTTQDQGKIKLAYDFSPTLRASYLLGWWQNNTTRTPETYLRDAAGNPVYSGPVSIDGRAYTLGQTDFSASRADQNHVMQALSVKSNTRSTWDWEVAASVYDYQKDQVRASGTAYPNAAFGGAGTLTDMSGTGWNTLALKGTWRPDGTKGAHIVDFGYQRDAYQLRTSTFSTSNWITANAGARSSSFNGDTNLQSLYAQDSWRIAKDWKTTLGGRLEQWQASNGSLSNSNTTVAFSDRNENYFSPKAAVAYQATPQWALKASLGRAIRFPTVSELYQGSLDPATNILSRNDPNLKPEKSWTSELTAERDLGKGLLRTTIFHEDTKDALYSQLNVATNVTNIQNVDQMRTTGLEVAYQENDVALLGLDLSGSVTFADSKTIKNANNPASVGKWQPRVPKWRASALATYRPDERWAYTFGARYSGRQYSQLDNSDVNGFAYTGVSSFFVTDIRVRYQIAKQWSASLGIDNLNNKKYWNFHPYPQRTILAELKFDLD